MRRSPTIPKERLTAAVILALAAAILSGCSTATRLWLGASYVQVPSEEGTRAFWDVTYRARTPDPERHVLDLYLPDEPGYPTLVFVHGGSLVRGNKDLSLGGYDIYANIGRFYSARGIGVAVVEYRLQPEVRWPEQVDDVAAAVAWVQENVPLHGGSNDVYLAGHSAGAWLVAHVGTDPQPLARYDKSPLDLRGVITISGSGFDMEDDLTWHLFGRERRWRKRFRAAPGDREWKSNASVVTRIGGKVPPFLILHAEREWDALKRQNLLLRTALAERGVPAVVEPIEKATHRRTVLMMSHPESPVSASVLRFVRGPERVLDQAGMQPERTTDPPRSGIGWPGG